jgi:hypothetical protein
VALYVGPDQLGQGRHSVFSSSSGVACPSQAGHVG